MKPPNFNPDDVKRVASAILELAEESVDDSYFYGVECIFCHASVHNRDLGKGRILTHKTDCVTLTAKDLLTGLEAKP